MAGCCLHLMARVEGVEEVPKQIRGQDVEKNGLIGALRGDGWVVLRKTWPNESVHRIAEKSGSR